MAEDELRQQNEEILATGDALDRRMEACTDELRTSNAQLKQKIAELEGAEAAVEERLRFEILLSQLSTRFLNLPPGEVDRQIEHGLQRLAQFLEVDRSTLFEFSQDKTHLRDPLMDGFGVRAGPGTDCF